jgi:hypothetical protein
MKALSVKNPWAYLIIYGGKDIENRTWEIKYRGPILIHASKTSDLYAYSYLSSVETRLFHPMFLDEKKVKEIQDSNGCILGSVELCACLQNSDSRWAEKGLWHWVLKDPKPCKPIPVKGSLGIWDYNGLYVG